MTDASEIARVAKGLTKAQRDLLLQDGGAVRSHRPAQILIHKGLWHDTPDEYYVAGLSTVLGSAVRAHLKGTDQ